LNFLNFTKKKNNKRKKEKKERKEDRLCVPGIYLRSLREDGQQRSTNEKRVQSAKKRNKQPTNRQRKVKFK
jgi:hypothetical protein